MEVPSRLPTDQVGYTALASQPAQGASLSQSCNLQGGISLWIKTCFLTEQQSHGGQVGMKTKIKLLEKETGILSKYLGLSWQMQVV